MGYKVYIKAEKYFADEINTKAVELKIYPSRYIECEDGCDLLIWDNVSWFGNAVHELEWFLIRAQSKFKFIKIGNDYDDIECFGDNDINLHLRRLVEW